MGIFEITFQMIFVIIYFLSVVKKLYGGRSSPHTKRKGTYPD